MKYRVYPKSDLERSVCLLNFDRSSSKIKHFYNMVKEPCFSLFHPNDCFIMSWSEHPHPEDKTLSSPILQQPRFWNILSSTSIKWISFHRNITSINHTSFFLATLVKKSYSRRKPELACSIDFIPSHEQSLNGNFLWSSINTWQHFNVCRVNITMCRMSLLISLISPLLH
jgi:hypothetical protein